MSLRYCFEEDYIARTLAMSEEHDLAVIDTDGIDSAVIQSAIDRGVHVYGYLNAGALERERSYYADYSSLRIASYDGWPGEYWVDVTAPEWSEHLVREAQKIKAAGAIGVYLDNTDIYYMCEHGFGRKVMRKVPSKESVYQTLRDVIKAIVNDIGLVVMPNGGDVFVRRLVTECKGLITTVNQEGVLYQDNRRQSKGDTQYYTEYLDWCKKQGLYIRGIEYTKNAAANLQCKAYYESHGWQGLYISKHKDLRGD